MNGADNARLCVLLCSLLVVWGGVGPGRCFPVCRGLPTVCVFACSVRYVALVRCRHVCVPCDLIASYSVTPQRLWFHATLAARCMLRQGMFQCCAFCLFSRQGGMAQGDSHRRLVGGWVRGWAHACAQPAEVLLRFRWWVGAVPSHTGPRLWFAHGLVGCWVHTRTHMWHDATQIHSRCSRARRASCPPHRPASVKVHHQHVRTFFCVYS